MTSRRKLIATAAVGATGIAAAKIADSYGLIPPDYKGPYGAGDTLTYAAQRLLASGSPAREFTRAQISKKPHAHKAPPQDAAFLAHQANGFANWRLAVDGLVARPVSLSVADVKAYPVSSQITQLICEEGWSYVAEWTGVPLSLILEHAGIQPNAKYVVYFSSQNRRVDSIDMADALHPQTLVTHAMNGADLPVPFGGPLRLRVPRQLGYKNLKFLNRILVTDSLEAYPPKSKYAWYAGI